MLNFGIYKEGRAASLVDIFRVTRDDLLGWADGGAAELPYLVRRLIVETASRLVSCSFPGGTGVSSGGWDGVLEVQEPSRFIPQGESGWELSVQKNSQRKAQSDFDKRAELPPNERAGVSYVQVICRPWTKAAEFERENNLRQEFASVHALNVDDLEQWLEIAPVTSAWFLEQVGKRVNGAQSIASYWGAWTDSTHFPIGSDLVLAGRDGQAIELRQRLSSPGIVLLGGRSREELIVFAAAAMSGASAEDRFKDAVVVTSSEAASAIFAHHSAAVVVSEPSVISPDAVPAEATVLIVDGSNPNPDINLGPVDPQVASELLRPHSPTFRAAEEDGALARRSLVALRRRHAIHPALHRPAWMSAAPSRLLRRVLLVGAWDGGFASDVDAMSGLVGMQKDDFEDGCRDLSLLEPEPVLAVVNQHWHLVSRLEALQGLGDLLSVADLRSFGDFAQRVLTTPEPIPWMSPDEQIAAQIRGEKSPFSASLRRGIAEGLALLGSHPVSAHDGHLGGQEVAKVAVANILSSANEDLSLDIWRSISLVLDSLAEAAPEEVLRGMRTGLYGETPLLAAVFADGADRATSFGSPPPSPHLGVLRALETMAWDKEYLPAVIEILARFHHLDPGGQWANRPLNSISSIVEPFHPDTSASWETRRACIESLLEKDPEVGWLVVEKMFASRGGGLVQPGPRFRNWKTGESRSSRSEVLEIREWSLGILLRDAGDVATRWTFLLARFNELDEGHRNELLSKLEAIGSSADEEFRRLVWPALHESVARADDIELDLTTAGRIGELIDLLAPSDPAVTYGWLFDPVTSVVDGISRFEDRDAFETRLAERRAEAVDLLVEDGSLDDVVPFAELVTSGWAVGAELADPRYLGQFDYDMLALLSEDDSRELASGYFSRRFRDGGWEVFDPLTELDSAGPEAVAHLFGVTADVTSAVERLGVLDSAYSDAFWMHFSVNGLGWEFGEIECAVNNLVDVGRIGAALDLISLYARGSETQDELATLALKCFETAIAGGGNCGVFDLRPPDFRLLFQLLAVKMDDAAFRSRAAVVEWYYLPAIGVLEPFPNLFAELALSPSLYCQMLGLSDPADEQVDGEGDEDGHAQRAAIRANAWRLLNEWDGPPGVLPGGGDPNPDSVTDWFIEVREQMQASGQAEIGDRHLGALLASVPSVGGEGWPPLCVCALLENAESDILDASFVRGVYNRRGIVSRAWGEGSGQETLLSERYEESAASLRTTYPRAASVVQSIADGYRREGRGVEEQAEATRRGLL